MGRTVTFKGKAAGDFLRSWKAARSDEAPPAEEPPMRPRLISLVRRLAEADCPRTTHKTFEELCNTSSDLMAELQFESASGADTRDGFIITALHSLERTTKAAKAWLLIHDKPRPKKKTFARKPAKITLPPTGSRLYKRKKPKVKK
jgi:hypothetical protein